MLEKWFHFAALIVYVDRARKLKIIKYLIKVLMVQSTYYLAA